MRRPLIASLAVAASIAGCSRVPEPPAGPANYAEAMIQASKHWELNRWSEAFAACDQAFRYADGTTRTRRSTP